MTKIKQMMTYASRSVAKENNFFFFHCHWWHKLVLVPSMAVPQKFGNHLLQILFHHSWPHAQRTIHSTTEILVHPC